MVGEEQLLQRMRFRADGRRLSVLEDTRRSSGAMRILGQAEPRGSGSTVPSVEETNISVS